jgi:FtsZ-binding cell division protein ZapB
VVELSCIAELEENNSRLQEELAEARARIAEVEGRENVLKSSYGSLCEDYGNLESMLAAAPAREG